MPRAGTPPDTRRDRWIPAAFVLFFLALVGLETWFVLLANRSFSGLVTEAAPAGVPAPSAPDWDAAVAFAPTGPLAGRLTLALTDASGAPLDPEAIVATAERTTRFPQLVPLVLRPAGPGTYVADLVTPLAGPWAIRIRLAGEGVSGEHLAAIEVMP